MFDLFVFLLNQKRLILLFFFFKKTGQKWSSVKLCQRSVKLITADVAFTLHLEPSILMFSVQRDDRGSVCTCAGEHLNKCHVFLCKYLPPVSLSYTYRLQLDFFITIPFDLYIYSTISWCSFLTETPPVLTPSIRVRKKSAMYPLPQRRVGQRYILWTLN